ncbi:MAG: oxidoreductase [Planctomycetaceae bacterium]|nr:oxidoreductase [Planctomycetaceae bacterium]
MADQIGWGIIGLGGIANALADGIAHTDTGRLVAVGSRTQEKAEAFGDKYDAPKRYASYQEVLDDPAVQAVYIALPNHLHTTWTVKCAEAGKAILCEKPFATNAAEAETAFEEVRRHGVFLMEAFMYRCHPQTARLVELIRDGVIGDVRVVHGSFAFHMALNYDNIRLSNPAAGGSIMDVGCYPVSMSRLIAGAATGKDFADPTDVKGVGHVGKISRVDEWGTVTLRFPGDILAALSTATQVSIDHTLRIWGSEGHIEVPHPWTPNYHDTDVNVIDVYRKNRKRVWRIKIEPENRLYAIEAEAVARGIAEGRSEAEAPCMTWADTVGNMKVLDAWRRELGVVFDRETDAGLKMPWTGRLLTVDANHGMPRGRVEGIDQPVSRLVMGAIGLHVNDMPMSCMLLDRFFECGGNCVDTSYHYGGGAYDRVIGRWMDVRGNRKEMVILGKGAHSPNNFPQRVEGQLAASLENLRTDTIDLYMLHRDNPDVPVGEWVDCLNEHKDAGRIRAFGGSNWTHARLAEANAYATAKGVTGFCASSPNFALARWNEPVWGPECTTAKDPDAYAWYQESQMPVFAWSSQAGGLFAGRFDRGADQAYPPHDPVGAWISDENFERLDRANALGERRGCTAIQIALAYVLGQPLNLFALIGPKRLGELITSLQALDVELTGDEMAWVNLETDQRPW